MRCLKCLSSAPFGRLREKRCQTANAKIYCIRGRGYPREAREHSSGFDDDLERVRAGCVPERFTKHREFCRAESDG